MNNTIKLLGVAAAAAMLAVAVPGSHARAWAEEFDGCGGNKYDCSKTTTCTRWNSAGNCLESMTWSSFLDVIPGEM